MALKGVILRRLLKIKKITLYTTCIFAKAHKRVWHTSKLHKSIRKEEENKVGDGTLVHHIIFYQLGIILQISGKLASTRYRGTIIFTDHFSRFIDGHLC